MQTASPPLSPPFLLGLTGSIGMGKTTTARMFGERGILVHDADSAVHDLYQGAGAPVIAEHFPDAFDGTGIFREKLSRQVRENPAALAKLESLIHPLVAKHRRRFLQSLPQGTKLVVLDVPLLFETGLDKECHGVLVVTASLATQRARVLARSTMDAARFEALLARQLPDADKRARAHFILSTDPEKKHGEYGAPEQSSLARAQYFVDELIGAVGGAPKPHML